MQLAQQFGITALLDRRFKYLSTGETRKTLLCQALMSEPDLLILDEPFDGLDVASRQQLAELLASLHQSGITLVLVLNRFDEIPEFVQFAGVLADCTLAETGAKEELPCSNKHSSRNWHIANSLKVCNCRSRMNLQHVTPYPPTNRALC